MIGAATGNRIAAKERSHLCQVCRAFLVLGKPGIVTAVTLTGYCAMVLAGGGLPEPATGLACSAALMLMASGAALMNSLLDRDKDRLMKRLVQRSAALERLGPAPVLVAAALASSLAVMIAWHSLNGRVVVLLCLASLSYVLCYTLLLKPYTSWAAVLGAVPGALPVLIGSAAVAPFPDAHTRGLFLVLLLWQPPHFWLLALTRLDDYRAAQLPVLPLCQGVSITRHCILLATFLLIPAPLLLWYVGPCSGRFAGCALVLGGWFFLTTLRTLNRGTNARPAFLASIGYLILLLSLVIADLIR